MEKLIGKYRAEVVDTKDPEMCGRVRVSCPKALGDTISNWAYPCFPPQIFSVPKTGDLVWIEFEGGCIDEPIWTGVFYTTKGLREKFHQSYSLEKTVIMDLKAKEE